MRYRFGDKAELMACWASARSLGEPVRSKAEAEVSAGDASLGDDTPQGRRFSSRPFDGSTGGGV